MARLVIGRHRLLYARENLLALRAHQHAVAGVVEIGPVDAILVVAAGPQGRFVHQVADVRAGQTDRAGGQVLEVDVAGQRDLAGMDLEDRQPALERGPIHRDVAVESPGTQQRRIEHVRPVGGGHDDDRLGLGEAVHLAEDLVQGLLAFVVAAADAGAAVTADRIDLVDEEDGRGAFLGRIEQVADAACAHADEHLNELRAVDGEEGDARLAGHGASQQGFARPRRPHQQNALGHAAPSRWNLAGSRRNSTISCSSFLTPSRPATSANVIGCSPCS